MKKKNPSIRNDVRRYFDQHPGVTVYVQDLAKEFNTEEERVMACVSNIINSNNMPGLERISRGGPWVYRPNREKNNDTLFRLLGKTKSGDLILEDEDGTLFRAKEME